MFLKFRRKKTNSQHESILLKQIFNLNFFLTLWKIFGVRHSSRILCSIHQVIEFCTLYTSSVLQVKNLRVLNLATWLTIRWDVILLFIFQEIVSLKTTEENQHNQEKQNIVELIFYFPINYKFLKCQWLLEQRYSRMKYLP